MAENSTHEKSTFVDMIQEATRQRWRRARLRTSAPAPEDKPRVGRWPPPRQAAWRLALLKPWKLEE
jgi:hypothetical protein